MRPKNAEALSKAFRILFWAACLVLVSWKGPWIPIAALQFAALVVTNAIWAVVCLVLILMLRESYIRESNKKDHREIRVLPEA